MPEASSTDVVKYVAQSASNPAMKPAIQRLAFNALNPLKVRYPANEPITPMETMSAPHVLRPPKRKKRA